MRSRPAPTYIRGQKMMDLLRANLGNQNGFPALVGLFPDGKPSHFVKGFFVSTIVSFVETGWQRIDMRSRNPNEGISMWFNPAATESQTPDGLPEGIGHANIVLCLDVTQSYGLKQP